MDIRKASLAGFAAAFLAASLPAQDVPSDVTFNLRQSFLEELLSAGPDSHSVGARWKVTLRITDRSAVHGIAADCEIHFGAKIPNNRIIAHPRGIVVEPPNVCKNRVPQIRQTGAIGSAWTTYYDAHVIDETCEVTGFPRVFSEHSTGGGSGGSNPDHVVEVHPATSMTCDGETVNYLPLIKIHAGMRRITDASTIACLSDRKLSARQKQTGSTPIYEFLEEGAKGGGGRCGNFVVVDAHIGKDYIRELTNGGDHVALARVWVGEDGPYPLKIYTYKGTSVDSAIASLMANPDEYAELNLPLHGLLTYDYFSIVQALQGANFQWLPSSELKEYREVRSPLALVVFGRAVQ